MITFAFFKIIGAGGCFIGVTKGGGGIGGY